MVSTSRLGTALFLSILIGLYANAEDSKPAAAGPYAAPTAMHIGGEGGWDYLTVDSDHHVLYVPRSTHTQVIDAATGKVTADIPGQQRNHGVAIVPELGRGFISDGKGASVVIFDLKTNAVLGTLKAADDADGIIYDPATKKVLVSCGDASALIVISPDVDPKAGKIDGSIDLGGKPEFLAADGKGKVYVNIENKDQVAVVDIKAMKVIDKWPTAPGGAPVGMAIDPAHGYLFVGCRNPQKLIVMSTEKGKVLANLPIGAGVDATKFDDPYILSSCRDGSLAVAREISSGKFDIVQTVKTLPGARTMGVDTSAHVVYLPTAEFEAQANPQSRPTPKPDSFTVLAVKRSQP